MEAEAQKINMLQDEVDHRMTSGTTSTSNITTATSTTASSNYFFRYLFSVIRVEIKLNYLF